MLVFLQSNDEDEEDDDETDFGTKKIQAEQDRERNMAISMLATFIIT